ncbi:2'-5' RNA ligase family protein [Luedemannella helvata]
MVAALELYFDTVAEQRIKTLWRALTAAGVNNQGEHSHGRHRPHVSLVAAHELDPVAINDALSGLAVPPPIELTFGHVGQFPGGVLWLGPAPTNPLLELHAEVVRRLDAAGVEFWPLYRPGVWVPHCTLSMTARGDAISTGARVAFDVIPLRATLTSAAVADHNREIYVPLTRTRAA